MKSKIESRLTALEVRFVPPEPWTITARYSDGRVEQLTAEQFAAQKRADPDNIRVIDRKVTENIKEFRAWLDLVYELASMDKSEILEI